jgi:hypothetical protein
MYQVPNEVHHELLNWSRWCWTGAWPHPGMVPILEDDEAPRLAPPHEASARVVQAAWDGMHVEARLVLRAEYPGRSGEGRAVDAARLGMSLQRYEDVLAWAARRIEEACNALCY